MRVTDADVDKQRAVETWADLEGIKQGHTTLSQFTNFYVKPKDAVKLTPQEIETMRKYTELQDRARQYAKTKREQIGIQQQRGQIGIPITAKRESKAIPGSRFWWTLFLSAGVHCTASFYG